jgi:hypothetical protein
MNNPAKHTPSWHPAAREPFLINTMCFTHDTEFKHSAVCDMRPEMWHSGARKTAISRQRLSKHAPVATNMHATTEEPQEGVFSMLCRGYTTRTSHGLVVIG